MESDSNSIKSLGTPSSLKTPNSISPGSRKQVGFTRIRPTLIIPPSECKIPQQYTAGIPATTPVYLTPAGPSMFNFQQQLHNFKDLTKSGLGIGEKCAYWLYNKLKTWSRKWFTHFFLTIVLVLYTVGGALLFEYIEAPDSNTSRKPQLIDIRIPRQQLIYKLRNLSMEMPDEISDKQWEFDAADLMQQYENEVMAAYVNNELALKNSTGNAWTFFNAIVFCGTVYTTIGYGHIYPQTVTGKALTIVYAIIGIPLFLIALTDFGKLFTRSIKFLWSYVRRLYYTGSCRQVRKTAHVEDIFKGAQMMYDIATFRRPSNIADPENNIDNVVQPSQDTPTTPAISNFEIDDEFNLPISVAIFILVVYLLFGAVIYWIWEGWQFFDSFYFVFISMSTVGFGDMVPDDPYCMIVSIVYLVFGLALMSMCINVVQVKLSDTFKQASSKIGATIGITVAEDDGSITMVPPANVEMPPVHDFKSLDSVNNSQDINENELEKKSS